MSDIRRPPDSGHPDDLLAGHVDGTLTATERADLQAHLDGCERCRAELALAGQAADALRGLPEIEPPWGLGREAIEESRKVPRHTNRARRWTAVAGVAAAAVLLVGLAVAVLRGPQDDGSNSGNAFVETSASQPKAASGPNSGAGSEDSAAAGRLVERQVNRNYGASDVEGLASLWATRAKSLRTAPPATQAASVAPTTAATSAGGATSAPVRGPATSPATSAATTAATGPSIESSGVFRDAASMVSCIDRAAELGQSARPVRVIVARFEEKPALFGIFLNGPGAGQ